MSDDEDLKLVLVVRQDLKMGKGKVIDPAFLATNYQGFPGSGSVLPRHSGCIQEGSEEVPGQTEGVGSLRPAQDHREVRL